MQTLFDEHEGGYRLQEFEFYNWGCFDHYIYRISPQGKTSLLTGANGSGKTTVVDALVTLLVPPGKRHYNQSSGADRKRERTETSYLLGAYGMNREGTQSARVRYLREPSAETYSILLGVFKEKGTNSTVTLGQIRSLISGRLNRVYFIAHSHLSIESLVPVNTIPVFKKKLKSIYNIQFYDSFNHYTSYFRRIFGLRSEKALNLFSHIVGVKVLGNLTDFIRINMIDTPPMEAEFEKLYDHYDQLLSAHRKIELAEKQLELLTPVIRQIDRYDMALKNKTEKEKDCQWIPYIFAEIILKKLDTEIADLKQEQAELDRRKDEVKTDLKNLRNERDSTKLAMDSNDVSKRVKAIEYEINLHEQNKEQKLKRHNRYVELAEELNLPKVKTEKDFAENRSKADRVRQETFAGEEKIDQNLFNVRKDLNENKDRQSVLEQEIISLKKRKSNIPSANINIRKRIADYLDLPPADIPFAGELLRIKDEEKDWEYASERILHNFALCLLIKEDYYKKVNIYVNKNDLKGRLVYFKMVANLDWDYKKDIDKNSLIYKIEIKPNTEYKEWLADYLYIHFNYVCLETTAGFERCLKAVTMKGLVKNEKRHEKDDRPRLKSRDNFVLGWDNLEKLRFLSRKSKLLKEDIVELEIRFTRLKDQRQKLEELKSSLHKFQEIKSYNELNWWKEAEKIKELAEEKQKLTETSKEYNELKQKLDNLEKDINSKEKELEIINQSSGSISHNISQREKKQSEYQQFLDSFSHVIATENQTYREKRAKFTVPVPDNDYAEIEKIRDKALENARKKLEILSQKVIDITKKCISGMNSFKNPEQKIVLAYPNWSESTIGLTAEIEYRYDFKKTFEKIKKDDLPRHKKDFRQFLNEKIHDDIINFNQLLENCEKEICESVETLNRVLKTIQYNKTPSTYIQINSEEENDPVIYEFRAKLKNILGDAMKWAAGDENVLEKTFKKMQGLILDLKNDDYKRKKILDVRNWRRFSAKELFKHDDSQKQYYEDSQSLSGGEKAKLAYTILASAIAYQFGISGYNATGHSFRFAIVDEAFSKVDPENSVYAMELFKQMQLQLMVVTPLDKINLVENYINSVHFVENSDGLRASLINLTMEEYEEKKKNAAKKTIQDSAVQEEDQEEELQKSLL